MGSFQNNFRGYAGLKSLHPATGAKAPPITGNKARESVFGAGGAEVIPLILRVLEERVGHHSTHDVHAVIIGVHLTTATTGKPRHWIRAAGFQFAAENILCHTQSLPVREVE